MINDLVISRCAPPASPAVAAARLAPQEKVERACLGLLWLAVCAYAAVFLGLTFRLYDRFATMSYDLAIFDQATWLISRGHSPFITVRGLPLLADHFSLILYPLAPLYWLWPSAKMLLLAQTLALALGALPLYALARRRLGSAPWALLLAAACCTQPCNGPAPTSSTRTPSPRPCCWPPSGSWTAAAGPPTSSALRWP